MNDWDRFNDQFRETEDEKRERWQSARKARTRAGKCWQCAKLIAECTCPNIKHADALLAAEAIKPDEKYPVNKAATSGQIVNRKTRRE